MRFYRESTDLMKTLIVTAIFALTSTVAAADQATYDKYMEVFNLASNCIGFGDNLEGIYFEEMVEVLGEDTAIEVMDVRMSALVRATSLFVEVPLESSMNKIWKQRFKNNANIVSGQVDGQDHGRSTYNAVGLEATVIKFFEQCKKQTWLDLVTP